MFNVILTLELVRGRFVWFSYHRLGWVLFMTVWVLTLFISGLVREYESMRKIRKYKLENFK